MTQPLYERYKDALRRGHVAALRGKVDGALTAYVEAAGLAPDRALPHASMGALLGRVGRLDEARSAFDAALARSPLDEASLRGRADVLVRLGKRVEAAEDLERLAESLAAAGRATDALDAARDALSLAESRERRRLFERLASTMGVRDGAETTSPDAGTLRDLEDDAGAIAPTAAGAAPPVAATATSAAEAVGDATTPAASGEGPGRGQEEDAAAEPMAEASDPTILVAEAEVLLDAGDTLAARSRLLEAIERYRAQARPDAALDAGLILLGIAPADPALHLALAELQLDRGWRSHASEKLRLLGRLAELRDDVEAGDAARALATARLGSPPEG